MQATHVILVEPLLDAGAERQALGRVHRIGQTRPTFVHRFGCRATVEENVLALGRWRETEGGVEGGGRSPRPAEAAPQQLQEPARVGLTANPLVQATEGGSQCGR